jgi:hypothetical protein
MGFCVCNGAILMCSFGAIPSTLTVLPTNLVNVSSQPMATVMDNKPFVNIMSFGMCSSLANPTVASATAAALGVLTPMPCIPSIVGTWVPGSTTVMVKGNPALTDSSTVMCAYGGVVKCNFAGQITSNVK